MGAIPSYVPLYRVVFFGLSTSFGCFHRWSAGVVRFLPRDDLSIEHRLRFSCGAAQASLKLACKVSELAQEIPELGSRVN